MLVVLYRDALAYVDKKFKTQYFKTKLQYVNLPGSSPAEIQQLARIGSSSKLTGCKSFAASFSKPSAREQLPFRSLLYLSRVTSRSSGIKIAGFREHLNFTCNEVAREAPLTRWRRIQGDPASPAPWATIDINSHQV